MNKLYFVLFTVMVGFTFGQDYDFASLTQQELTDYIATHDCPCVNLIFVLDLSDTLASSKANKTQIDLMDFLIRSLETMGLLNLNDVAVVNIASNISDIFSPLVLNADHGMTDVDVLMTYIVEHAKTGGPTFFQPAFEIVKLIIASGKLDQTCVTRVVIASDFKPGCIAQIPANRCNLTAIQEHYNYIEDLPNVDICPVVIKSDYSMINGSSGIAGVRPVTVQKSYTFDLVAGEEHNNEFFKEVLFGCPLDGCTPKPPTGEACTEFNDPAIYCQQCMERRNNLDYYPDPCNCSNYYHCFFNGTDYIGILRPCPPGSKFSDMANHCLPTPFNCTADDPCHSNETVIAEGYWQAPGECGIWYQCSNYYSVVHCCPEFQSFNISWRDCMADENCTSHHTDERCQRGITVPCFSPIIFDTDKCNDTQYNVIRQVNPDSPFSYLVIVEGFPEPIVIECPQNTQFNLNSCKCNVHASPRTFLPPDECFLNITCDNDPIVDSSISNNYVDNTGIVAVTPQVSNANALSVCRFNGPSGTGWLELPYFQGKDFRFALTACWWFRWDNCADTTNTNRYVIFSNRGEDSPNPAIGNVDPSILVKTVAAGTPPIDTAVEVTIRTTSQTSFTATSAPITCGVWNHICFTFSNTGIQIYVNGQASGTFTPTDGKPIFWMTHCPLTIGQDKEELNGQVLDGLMDEVLWCSKVYSQTEIDNLYQSQLPNYNTP